METKSVIAERTTTNNYYYWAGQFGVHVSCAPVDTVSDWLHSCINGIWNRTYSNVCANVWWDCYAPQILYCTMCKSNFSPWYALSDGRWAVCAIWIYHRIPYRNTDICRRDFFCACTMPNRPWTPLDTDRMRRSSPWYAHREYDWEWCVCNWIACRTYHNGSSWFSRGSVWRDSVGRCDPRIVLRTVGTGAVAEKRFSFSLVSDFLCCCRRCLSLDDRLWVAMLWASYWRRWWSATQYWWMVYTVAAVAAEAVATAAV